MGFDVPSFTTLGVYSADQLSPALRLRANIAHVRNRQAPQDIANTAGQGLGMSAREHTLWVRTRGEALTAKF